MASVKDAKELAEQVQEISSRLEGMLSERMRRSDSIPTRAKEALAMSSDESYRLKKEVHDLVQQREAIKMRLDQLISVIEEALIVNQNG